MTQKVAKKKTSKAVLERAANVLQKAHDLIESGGFNIDRYKSEIGGTINYCYIGSIRAAAGIVPRPDGGMKGPADTGDGPELTIALEVLDKTAAKSRKVSKKSIKKYVKGELRYKYYFPGEYNLQYAGRYVEAFGLALDTLTQKEQEVVALDLLRKALREIHKELES